MTPYHADTHTMRLESLRDRLQNTDLVPSQQPLLVSLEDRLTALEQAGIGTVADLQGALKTAKAREGVARQTGIDVDWLNLLRRTVAGFFPKPRPLREVDWIDPAAIATLATAGLANTRHVFEAKAVALSGLDRADRDTLRSIADLCRIQWVSPSFARALIAAGYADAASVAAADPQAMAATLDKVHRDTDFYGHKIGLRDIRRLIAAAGYVP